MHRKDYIKAAAIIADQKSELNPIDHQRMVNAFVQFFENDNPRFDKKKFLDACNPEN